MIRFLLAATSLDPRLSTGDCHAFASTIGTPQDDSLSPVLFAAYLEAAHRDLRSRLPPRPPADARLPLDVEYADDIDFISYSGPYLNEIERIAPDCLAEWSLHNNAAKTGRTSVSRQVDRAHEPWRTTCKLGSILGDAEDVAHRMQLANVSGHLGLDENRACPSRCTSPSSPAADHRYPLATPYLKRCTLPTNSIQPHQCRHPGC